MTMRALFKKVDTYNELAEMMRTNKARVYFYDGEGCITFGEHFTNYEELVKYIKNEYFDDVVDAIIKANDWEFDREKVIESKSGIKIHFTAELVAA